MCQGGCFNRKLVRQEWNTCSRGFRLLFSLLFHSFFWTCFLLFCPLTCSEGFTQNTHPMLPPPPPPPMHVRACTHTHTCMCTHTQACLRACMHAHTHSLTHTSIHTHTVSQIHLTPPHHPTLISFISGDHTNVPPPSSTCLPCPPPPPPPHPHFLLPLTVRGKTIKKNTYERPSTWFMLFFFSFFFLNIIVLHIYLPSPPFQMMTWSFCTKKSQQLSR